MAAVWTGAAVPGGGQAGFQAGELIHETWQASGYAQLVTPLQSGQDDGGQIGGMPLTGQLGGPGRPSGHQRADRTRQ